jgi:hypothetical protein
VGTGLHALAKLARQRTLAVALTAGRGYRAAGVNFAGTKHRIVGPRPLASGFESLRGVPPPRSTLPSSRTDVQHMPPDGESAPRERSCPSARTWRVAWPTRSWDGEVYERASQANATPHDTRPLERGHTARVFALRAQSWRAVCSTRSWVCEGHDCANHASASNPKRLPPEKKGDAPRECPRPMRNHGLPRGQREVGCTTRATTPTKLAQPCTTHALIRGARE